LKKNNWKAQSRINSILRDKIDEKQNLIKNRSELSQPSKPAMKVMLVTGFNKNFIPKIIFHLIT
jgi:hypothetical protein